MNPQKSTGVTTSTSLDTGAHVLSVMYLMSSMPAPNVPRRIYSSTGNYSSNSPNNGSLSASTGLIYAGPHVVSIKKTPSHLCLKNRQVSISGTHSSDIVTVSSPNEHPTTLDVNNILSFMDNLMGENITSDSKENNRDLGKYSMEKQQFLDSSWFSPISPNCAIAQAINTAPPSLSRPRILRRKKQQVQRKSPNNDESPPSTLSRINGIDSSWFSPISPNCAIAQAINTAPPSLSRPRILRRKKQQVQRYSNMQRYSKEDLLGIENNFLFKNRKYLCSDILIDDRLFIF